MAKMTKKIQIKILHLALFIIMGLLIFINIDSLSDLATDNPTIASIVLILVMFLPAFLHMKLLRRKKRK
ncbi:MAG: hypothetical protein PQJ49_03030 [Sphaerochaetaceae bacterium]|nr:hypothetical protein [Sphaerochaetaceae bacterium]